MSKTKDIRYRHLHAHYWEGAETIGNFKFPKLCPTQSIPEKICSFSEIKSIDNHEDYWLDFFIDDYRYNNLWQTLDSKLLQFSKFAGIIGTDYSMCSSYPPSINIGNCFKNRTFCYYLQRLKFDVIPVASWFDIQSLDWSLDGLPNNGTIAISSNGCLSSNDSFRILIDGIHILIDRLKPSHLLICGRYMPELSCYGSRIIYYPNFSQRRRRPYDGITRKIW